MNGEDWFNYIQQNDMDIQRYSLVRGGDVQCKLYERQKKITLSNEAWSGNSAISIKKVSHELGHAKNNSVNKLFVKLYYLTEFVWGIILAITFLFFFWNLLSEVELLKKLEIQIIYFIILLTLYTLFSLLFIIIKYMDEKYADVKGLKYVEDHLSNALSINNYNGDPQKFKKEIEDVFAKDYVPFWKHSYTKWILGIWLLLTVLIIYLYII